MDLSIVFPPILGAFIGYVTNWLAIKMLFRPYEEKYIFGIRVPFTPGLIPRRRKEIAEAIALTVEEHILPIEKLEKLFQETGYKERLHKRVELVIDELVDTTIEDIKRSIKEGISIGKLTIKGTIVVTALDKLLDRAIDKAKAKLKKRIKEKAAKIIEEHIEEELPIMLSQINIKQMVVETFMELDIETMEKIVVGFSEKQLKHITWTGAILGAFIGLFESLYIIFSRGI